MIGISSVLGLGSWLLGASFLKPLVAALTAAVELIKPVAAWVLETAIAGARHLFKSVSATLLVLALCWGAYAYGKLTAPQRNQPGAVATPSKPDTVKTPGENRSDWRDGIFGN